MVVTSHLDKPPAFNPKHYFPVANSDHTKADCVAVGILTHGEWEKYKRADQNTAIADIIKAANADLRLEDLTAPFRAKNCHTSLRGKPKLFFIQVQ